MLKTTTKISAVSNLSDARYCAGMGVEMLGFCADESSDTYVSPTTFKEITGWLSGVKTVIESDSNHVEFLLSIIDKYNFSYLQVSHNEIISTLKSQINIPIILKIEADQDADNIDGIIKKYAADVAYFLIESRSSADFGGDWPMFLQQFNVYPILLGFGINPNNVIDILAQCQPAGIALKGSQETRPGFKDYGDLMDILEILDDD
jgi:phosphoribosylanthranilate isomerase